MKTIMIKEIGAKAYVVNWCEGGDVEISEGITVGIDALTALIPVILSLETAALSPENAV